MPTRSGPVDRLYEMAVRFCQDPFSQTFESIRKEN